MWVLQEELLGTPEVSSINSIPTGFCSQKYGGLIFLALVPWAGGPVVGLGLLIPKISLFNYIYHMWVWDQTIPCLHPSYQFGWMWFFFNSVVVRLPFNLISDGSK